MRCTVDSSGKQRGNSNQDVRVRIVYVMQRDNVVYTKVCKIYIHTCKYNAIALTHIQTNKNTIYIKELHNLL